MSEKNHLATIKLEMDSSNCKAGKIHPTLMSNGRAQFGNRFQRTTVIGKNEFSFQTYFCPVFMVVSESYVALLVRSLAQMYKLILNF